MRSFLNGEMVDAPTISALDEGLLYGYGVYETLRVYSGVPFRLQEHVRRLRASAQKVDMRVPSDKKITDAIHATVSRNALKDAALRVVLTAGAQSDWGNAEPSLLVLAKPVSPVKAAFKAVSVPFHRDVAQAKTLNCLTAVMARKRAVQAGADEALFRIGSLGPGRHDQQRLLAFRQRVDHAQGRRAGRRDAQRRHFHRPRIGLVGLRRTSDVRSLPAIRRSIRHRHAQTNRAFARVGRQAAESWACGEPDSIRVFRVGAS